MDRTADASAPQAQPLLISRTIAASPATVFAAWTSAERVARWFGPQAYAIDETTVRAEVGGPFALRMRAPDGEVSRIRGTFVEVVPQSRLVIEMRVTDGNETPLFEAATAVDFIATPAGTRLDIAQTYELADPVYAAMTDGAPEGWRQTLDNLEREIART